jgi:hypothetical protein
MVEYEFTTEQNVTFDKLYATLRRFVFILAISMLLLITWGFALLFDGGRPMLQIIGVVGTGVLGLVICDLFLRPLSSIQRITTTEGRDISVLMRALTGLNSAHNFLRLILVVGLLVRAIGFIDDMGWL